MFFYDHYYFSKTHDEIIYKIQNYAKLKIERNLLFSSLK